jgi:elongator complex protein 3
VWCRIDRLIRDISKKWVSAGMARTNLRQVLQAELLKEGKKCQCIRCREVRGGVYDTKVALLVNEWESLGGKELFLSYESGGKLFSMLRLRLPDKKEKMMFDELKGAALVREVHTYGQVAQIDTQDGIKTQHRGLGKRLMLKAEEIAKIRGYKKIAVISAVGTREYYKKLGYSLEGTYMVKDL